MLELQSQLDERTEEVRIFLNIKAHVMKAAVAKCNIERNLRESLEAGGRRVIVYMYM